MNMRQCETLVLCHRSPLCAHTRIYLGVFAFPYFVFLFVSFVPFYCSYDRPLAIHIHSTNKTTNARVCNTTTSRHGHSPSYFWYSCIHPLSISFQSSFSLCLSVPSQIINSFRIFLGNYCISMYL